MLQEFIRTAGIDPGQSEVMQEITAGDGKLGQAWGRLVETLNQAISDPVIEKNATCVEFLQIVRSLANTPVAGTTIDMVFEPLKAIFQSQMAYDNTLKSRDKFFLAKFWMYDDLEKKRRCGREQKQDRQRLRRQDQEQIWIDCLS